MVSKLDFYKIFYYVGKHGSFSKAAKELYITQPAVSQAIMQLEQELDTRLFSRTPKGVTLTNEGEILFEHVHSALNLLVAGEAKISEFKHLTTGQLRIGVGDTISKHFLLPYLEDFHNRYPKIKFKIMNGTTIELTAYLKAGEIDLAVCNFPIDDASIEQRPVMEVHDIFVCGEKYKHHFTEPADVQQLNQYPMIFLEPNSNSRVYVEDYLLKKGIKIAPEFELGSHDLLLEFARINLGIACVTKEFALEHLNKKYVHEIPLAESIPSRSIGVCYLKGVSLSSAATRFLELLL